MKKLMICIMVLAAMLMTVSCGNVESDNSDAERTIDTSSGSESSSAETESITTSITTTVSETDTTTTTAATTAKSTSSTTTTTKAATKATTKATTTAAQTQPNRQPVQTAAATTRAVTTAATTQTTAAATTKSTTKATTKAATATTKATTKTTTTKATTKATTTAASAELTQADIDRLVKELQAYSNEKARPWVETIYAANGYSSADEWMADIEWMTPSNSSWDVPDIIFTVDSYSKAKDYVKRSIDFDYKEQPDVHIVVYAEWCPNGVGCNDSYVTNDCWNIYCLR